jgi:cyclase
MQSLAKFSSGIWEHDEIVIIDAVASLYGFDNWLLRESSSFLYFPLPLAIGGAITSLDLALRTIEKGADKVVLNSGAIRSPAIIEEIANNCGRQAVVLQVDTRRVNGVYRCFTNGARELSTLTADQWLRSAQQNGAGEIHLTAIETEGTDKSFPSDLAELARSCTSLPLIISGGILSADAIAYYRRTFEIDAFSISSITNRLSKPVNVLKQELIDLGETVR